MESPNGEEEEEEFRGEGRRQALLVSWPPGARQPLQGGQSPDGLTSVWIHSRSLFSSFLGFQPLSDLSSYEIVVPRRITRERRDLPKTSQDTFSYVIAIEGKDHTLVLERNRALMPKDFTLYTYKKDGTLHTEKPRVGEHCHYHGHVEGTSYSLVAVSICFGLRGMIQIENVTFGVEPIDKDRHLVYPLSSVKAPSSSCGVSSLSHSCKSPAMLHPIGGGTPHLRNKRGLLLQTRYVELFIVVDKERYMLLGENKTAIREEMMHLANYLDGMYATLNIRIVLVGLEIWTFQNKISLEGGAADVLANFVQWRERDLILRRRHDSAQLVMTKGFGDVAGMAYVGTICSKSNAGGINVFGPISVQMFASIVAHELGHNLGMNHDDERHCHCPTDNCIMKSKASGARNFSSCSEEDFEKLTLNKGGSCLLNIPRPEETYSIPYCGNKLVDAGEECDCGSPEECKTDPCCEPGTCKLRPGAECGYGDCCRNCHYMTKATECREKSSECDLPEYCNGTSAFCPQDVTIQNGHPCKKGEAYCYNGVCQYYEAQCQAIFGPKAKAAPEICFSAVNSKGDRFGNCGYHNYDYKKCSSSNSMCGKLQCENVKTLPVFGIEPAFIQSPIKGSTCWGVDFQLGSDVPDPGMVNEGTKCAPGKICKHYQCVDVAVLGYDCDISNQCNGQGVCNSNKNCHCNSGWAPPFCNAKGYGGSVDSGPPYNDEDTTTRNWLLAFFFLILPLLLSVVFCYLMRNRLGYSLRPLIESCCGCFSRSRHRRQEPVGSEFPPNVPYPPMDTSSQMNMQTKRYPVPSYTANQQPYGEHFYYAPPHSSPRSAALPTEQHYIPSRPPPPAMKPPKTQEPLIPSRPAPLPPK
nr:disintegrin and metalloproteinase domain-containing protein 9 [Anolis sagrei ordinatus]